MPAPPKPGERWASFRTSYGPPMTLSNMRQNGVRMVIASCANCGRSADVNVDAAAPKL